MTTARNAKRASGQQSRSSKHHSRNFTIRENAVIVGIGSLTTGQILTGLSVPPCSGMK
jgi:hypothetical protein